MEREGIVGGWEDARIERFLCDVRISHVLIHKAEVRGHSPRPHLETTYHASDSVCVSSSMGEPRRRNAHEVMEGLLLRAEERVIHDGTVLG